MITIAIIVSSFNQPITSSLYHGAEDALAAQKTSEGQSAFKIERFDVPGAFELPLAAKLCATSGKYAGIICLGCVIQGQTPHFDYVCSEAARGIMEVGLQTLVPVIFGVLTTQTIQQALDRSQKIEPASSDALASSLHQQIKPVINNKGIEAAHGLLQMLKLKQRF